MLIQSRNDNISIARGVGLYLDAPFREEGQRNRIRKRAAALGKKLPDVPDGKRWSMILSL